MPGRVFLDPPRPRSIIVARGSWHRPPIESRTQMFGSIGMPELIIIFVIALIIFGPKKLPELGRSLGRSLNEFKRASNELKNTLEEEVRIEEQREKTAAEKAAEKAAAPVVTPPVAASSTVARSEDPLATAHSADQSA